MKPSALEKINDADLSAKDQKTFFELKEKLEGGSTINWDNVLQGIQSLPQTGELRTRLAGLVGTYIQTAFQLGQFPNLDGIAPVLEFLEISDIEFDPEAMKKIQEFYERYSVGFLYSMSPSLIGGKLWDGKSFDKIEYVREILRKRGEPEDHLTDQYIKSLWNLREVLVKLHQNLRGRPLNTAPKKLVPFVHLLMADNG
ncbi:MAG TPA: hypothetical protein VFQ60_01515 [Patescibacteria group bacterium]|nr:hypothetical protein [Patescibacteria group bacterium]